MLIIRRGQMAAIERAVWSSFVDRVARHVHTQFVETTAGMEWPILRKRMEATLARARQYGFTLDQDLLRFAELSFKLGETFDRDNARSWVQEILNSGAYTPHTKMDLLTQLADAELGLQAEEPLTEYDEPELPDEYPETPDEEVEPLDEVVEDFEPESEEPEELPDDIIELDEDALIEEAVEEEV